MKKTLLLFLITLQSIIVFGAYLKNVPIKVKQPDGQVVQCYATGDEFYHRVHDINNFTIIQNKSNGYYVYAMLSNDELIPTPYKAGIDNPALHGLKPGIDISYEKIKNITEMFIKKFINYPKPLHYKSAKSTGNINNLVIFIRFKDETEFTDNSSFYADIFNNTTSGASSMINYFNEVSYNALNVSSSFYPNSTTTVLSYKDTNNRAYYQLYDITNNPLGYVDENDRRTREHILLKNASEAIASQVPPSLNLDYNNDGNIDNVCFIVKGDVDGWSNLLWPHRWSLFSETANINGLRVYDYNFQLQERLVASSDVGVLCHEMFHTLGSPDLYHYSQDGLVPVGPWDVMESNNNPPQSMCSYMKYRYGEWINNIPEITSSGYYTLNPLTSPTNNCFKLSSMSSNSTGEYFVLEYRKAEGTFEGTLPGSGLVIYRINPNQDGVGNRNGPPDEVYVYRPGGTLSANGSINLANFSSNTARTSFNNNTNPNCFLITNDLADINISQISATGNTISFYVGITPMTYVSNNTYQNYSDVSKNSQQQQIIGIDINTSGVSNPIQINSLKFNTNGTTNILDISNAQLYYTGNNSTFSTSTDFGNAISTPNGNMTFSDSQILSSGHNYFWLTYDIANNAQIGNYVDAECIQFNINGTNYTPNNPAPTGKRKISNKYADIPYNQNFELQWENNLSLRDIPDLHWENNPSTGDNSWRRQNDGISASWTSNGGIVTPNNSSGAANFHSWDASIGSTGTLDLFLNCSAIGMKLMSFDYQNESGSDSLYLLFSKDNGQNWETKGIYTTAQWQTYTLLLDTTVSDSCILRFHTVSDYGESDIGIDNIKISNFPIASFVASRTEIFQTENISFTDNSIIDITNWNWTFSGATPLTSTAQNPFSITYNNAGRYDVKLKVANIYGTDSLIKQDYIYVKSIINAGADKHIICSGSVRLFTELSFNPFVNAITYSWNPSTGLNNANIQSPIATPLQTTQYIVTVTDGILTAYDTVVVFVENNMIATAVDDISINCLNIADLNVTTNHTLGDFVSLNGADYMIYNCQAASFGKNLLQSYANGNLLYTQDLSSNYNGCASFAPGTFNGKIAVINRGTCTYSQKANNAQAAGAKGLIIVNNTGNNNETASMAGTGVDSIRFPCVMIGRMNGDSLKKRMAQYPNINASLGYMGPPLTFAWSPNYNIDNINSPTPKVNPKTTTQYSVLVSDGNCSASDQAVVNVLQPSVSLGNDTVYCDGDSIIYDLRGIGGVSYLWNDLSNDSLYIVRNQGTYSVIVYNIDGCYNSDTVDVRVNYMASNAGTINGSTEVCLGGTNILYQVNPITNAESYIWTLPSGAFGISDSNSILVTFESNAIDGNISVAGMSTCGIGNSSSLFVNINPLPNAPVISIIGTTLVSSYANNNQWYDNNGLISGQINQNFTPSVSGEYYVIVNNGNGCISPPSEIYHYNLGISDESYKEIAIYPNPTDEYLYVDNKTKSLNQFSIYSIHGKLVYESLLQPSINKLNIKELKKGVYIIKINIDGNNSYKKLIKN